MEKIKKAVGNFAKIHSTFFPCCIDLLRFNSKTNILVDSQLLTWKSVAPKSAIRNLRLVEKPCPISFLKTIGFRDQRIL